MWIPVSSSTPRASPAAGSSFGDRSPPGRATPFYCYETKQGYLYDQHAPAYEDFLLAAFPEFSDRPSVGDSGGMHSIEPHDDEDPRQLWAVFVKRFEQLGVVQMGTPAGDRKVVLSTDDPILGKPAGRSSPHRPWCLVSRWIVSTRNRCLVMSWERLFLLHAGPPESDQFSHQGVKLPRPGACWRSMASSRRSRANASTARRSP